MASKPNKEPTKTARSSRYTVLKVPVYPTPEQAKLLEKTFGCCRYLWNHMLADAQEFYAATDTHYIPTPARYKKEAPFLKEVDSQALCAVHQNLRKAYLDFFRNPKAFYPPKPKTKKARKDSFTVYCRPYHTGPSLKLMGNGLQMPKLGLLKIKLYRKPLHWWSLRFVTITKTKSGKYFCSMTFGYETKAPPPILPTPERTVGLNYSMSHFYVDSDGNTPELPPQIAAAREKLSRMQRKLSRMQQGSKNYAAQMQKIRLQYEHIANQRRDFAHQQSRRIANAWDAVCVRDADLNEMAQQLKGGNVLDSGFGMFRAFLRYKLEAQGKQYIDVNPYDPTAKTCHACGGINEKLPPRARTWVCPHCGEQLTRDENTARNIRDFGLAAFVQQAGVA